MGTFEFNCAPTSAPNERVSPMYRANWDELPTQTIATPIGRLRVIVIEQNRVSVQATDGVKVNNVPVTGRIFFKREQGGAWDADGTYHNSFERADRNKGPGPPKDLSWEAKKKATLVATQLVNREGVVTPLMLAKAVHMQAREAQSVAEEAVVDAKNKLAAAEKRADVVMDEVIEASKAIDAILGVSSTPLST